MKTIATFIFLLTSLIAHSNDTLLVQEFIPDEFEILELVKEDLNDDGIEDFLLALKLKSEDTAENWTHPLPRPLIILKGISKSKIEFWARNDKVVYCKDCGGIFGDPWAGIEAEKGAFTVHHFGGSNWRWSNSISFILTEKQDWVLNEVKNTSFWVFAIDSTTKTTVETKNEFGVVKFEDYSEEE